MVAADGQFVARLFPCRLVAFLALADGPSGLVVSLVFPPEALCFGSF